MSPVSRGGGCGGGGGFVEVLEVGWLWLGGGGLERER